MPDPLEVGIQLHAPTFKGYSLRELIELSETAAAEGLDQIWVTDNLGQRSLEVMLAALASRVPIKLGTAVAVQYFRSPLELAGAAATVSELMDGRELGISLARGNGNTPSLVRSPKPISMLRETAQCMGALFAGETIRVGEYPSVADYFNLMPDASFKLDVPLAGPIRLYSGGNGPLALEVAGETMDGVMFGSTVLVAARTGRLPELLETADKTAARASRPSPMPRVAEIKLSVAADRVVAREWVKESIGSRMLGYRRRGYADQDFQTLGIEPADIERLQGARDRGVPRKDLNAFVTDAMIDAIFVAGDPADCREQIGDVCAMARAHGFHQLMFSELGPDAAEALRLMCAEIIPAIRKSA